MANADKILCPGCGAEMELASQADYGLLYGFQYHCPRCGWDSPLMKTEREARDMAVKRFAHESMLEPMRNPVNGALWDDLPVVRCNNCIFFGKQPEYMRGVIRPDTGLCMYTGKLVLPDDFCSNAAEIVGGAADAKV